MNKQDQEAYFNAFVEKMRATMLAKGDDYAGQDRLDNFKRAGAITGIGAPMQCLSLIATKVARLSSLIGGNKDPRNESVDDSILDLTNYSVLLAMVIQDLKKESEFKELERKAMQAYTLESFKDLKKTIGNLNNLKNIDINDEAAPNCGTCGRQMRIVRPGEYECVKRKCKR